MIIVYWTLMIGFMCGVLAKAFTPQLKQGDLFTTMTIGLIASVLAGWIGSLTKLYEFGSYYGLVASFIGSAAVLFYYHEYIATYGPPKTRKRPNN